MHLCVTGPYESASVIMDNVITDLQPYEISHASPKRSWAWQIEIMDFRSKGYINCPGGRCFVSLDDKLVHYIYFEWNECISFSLQLLTQMDWLIYGVWGSLDGLHSCVLYGGVRWGNQLLQFQHNINHSNSPINDSCHRRTTCRAVQTSNGLCEPCTVHKPRQSPERSEKVWHFLFYMAN